MLAITERLTSGSPQSDTIDVSILSIATAVPRNLVTQQEVAERAKTVWPQFHKLEQLYTNTGIERRYAANRRTGTSSRMAGRSGRKLSVGTRLICSNGLREMP